MNQAGVVSPKASPGMDCPPVPVPSTDAIPSVVPSAPSADTDISHALETAEEEIAPESLALNPTALAEAIELCQIGSLEERDEAMRMIKVRACL